MLLSGVEMYIEAQPDFDKLKAKGWEHPLDLKNEPMESSLVKTFRGTQAHIIKKRFSLTRVADQTYTLIYLHEQSATGTRLKGEGPEFETDDAIETLLWLESELEGTV